MRDTLFHYWRAAAAVAVCFLGSCASTDESQARDLAQQDLGVAVAPTAARAVYLDTQGQRHDVGAALDAGRQVAFVFWQPWCASCKGEAPIVSRAAAAFADSMDVIGVVSGPDEDVDAESVAESIRSWGMAYPTIRDANMELTAAFDVQGVPTIIIVDPDGTVTYRSHLPPAEWGHASE